MRDTERQLMEKLERHAWGIEPMRERFAELAAENARLQGIVAELLIRNQKLRELQRYEA